MLKFFSKNPLFILIGVTLITIAISAYTKHITNVTIVNQGKNKAMSDLNDLISNDLRDQANRASSRASLIANLPITRKNFREGNREALIAQFEAPFLLQKVKYEVVEATFWTPPGIAFLRLFDTKRFGENVSSYLKIVSATLENKRGYQGVDLGRYGISIRGSEIVEDEKGLIGMFIVGMNFNSVLENIKNDTGFDAAVFGDDKWLREINTVLPNPDQEKVIGGYRLLEVTNWKKIRPILNASLLAASDNVVYKIQTVSGIDYGVVNSPIHNFAGKQIGSVVAVKNFKNYQALLKASIVDSTAFALLQGILIVGAILLIYNAMLIRPIETLSENIDKLREGKGGFDIKFILKSDNEVGDLAKNVERLKMGLKIPDQPAPKEQTT